MLASALALLLAATPQGPLEDLEEVFAADAVVRGAARDANGDVIAGARARIEPSLSDLERRRTVAVAWNRVRVPPILVDGAGNFALPLTGLFRDTWVPELGQLDLVVEAPGHHRLRIPLPSSLEGLVTLDSRPVPVGPGDVLELELGEGDGRLLVVECGLGKTLHDRAEVPVPADGRIAVPIAPAPPLAALRDVRSPAPWWWRIALLDPGRSIGFTAVRRTDAGLSWEPATGEKGAKQEITVARADGEPVEGLRALYRGPDAGYRWFSIANEGGGAGVSVARRDTAMELIALVATDTDVAFVDASGGAVELAPSPARSALELRVVDPSGAPIPEAEVTIWPLEAGGEPRDLRVGVRPLVRGRRTAANGRLRIPLAGVNGPMQVWVRARGFSPRAIRELDGVGDEPLQVVLQPAVSEGDAAEVTVEVVDASGAAVSGALVLVPAGTARVLRDIDLPITTDDLGRAVVPASIGARLAVTVVAAGRLPASLRVTVEEYRITERIALEPARELRVVTQGLDGVLAPYTRFRVAAAGHGHDATAVVSDARGLAWLRRLSTAGMEAIVEEPAGRLGLPESGEVLELRSSPQIGVVLRAPRAAADAEWRLVRDQGRGGASTSNESPDGDPSRRSAWIAMRWIEGAGDVVRIGLGDGPPLEVNDSAVEGAAGEGRGPVVLDQREVVRRIPLRIEGVPADRLAELRIEPRSPHYSGRLISTRIGNLVRIEHV